MFTTPDGHRRQSDHRRTRVALLGVLAFFAVTLTGCGDDTVTAADPTTTTAAPGRSDPSTPAAAFAINPSLPGWTVATATDGSVEPVFSDDSFGGVRPMAVLVPDDWSGIDDHRWVEVMSIDGSGDQGGFLQELPAYLELGASDGNDVINGHAAIAMSVGTPRPNGERTAAFVAVATDAGPRDSLLSGNERGILVTGPEEDLQLFKEVAAATTVDDERTPKVDPVPAGFRVLGALTAAQALTSNDRLASFVPEGRRVIELRPAAAENAGTVRDNIVLTALPGDGNATLLKLIEAAWHSDDVDRFEAVQTFAVRGADANLVTCCDPPDGVPGLEASAWLTIDDRPFALYGPGSALGTPELVTALASHITIVDDSQWTASTTPTTVPAIGSGLPTTVAVAPPTSG